MIKVKTLEWVEGDDETCSREYHTAKTPFGITYWQIEGQWGIQQVLGAGGPESDEDIIDPNANETAKSAAQADYERRILSAIEPEHVNSREDQEFGDGVTVRKE